jgi:hypothetical protein
MSSTDCDCNTTSEMLTKILPPVIAGTLFLLSELVGMSKSTDKNSVTEMVMDVVRKVIAVTQKNSNKPVPEPAVVASSAS